MRWAAKRKEEVVVALEKGLMTTAKAQRQYGLSETEIAAWRRYYAAYGRPGLLVTKLPQPHRSHKRKGRRGHDLVPTAAER